MEDKQQEQVIAILTKEEVYKIIYSIWLRLPIIETKIDELTKLAKESN